MKQYLELLEEVLTQGVPREDRTGTGTYELFGRQMRFDLRQGFPAVTTKRLFFKGVVHELLWMLSGSTNVNDLPEFLQHWWRPWAKEDGSLGPTYGVQLRQWPLNELGRQVGPDLFIARRHGVDQIENLITSLRENPDSRRHILSLWNVGHLKEMQLPPCHGVVTQFNVTPPPSPPGGEEEGAKGVLNCLMYQRSGDLFIGVPVNIAFYSLLTHIIAQVCDLEVGEFIHVLGSAHIYKNHVSQVREQLGREPKALPQLRLDPDIRDIDDFEAAHISLEGYEHWPAIKAPVAV